MNEEKLKELLSRLILITNDPSTKWGYQMLEVLLEEVFEDTGEGIK